MKRYIKNSKQLVYSGKLCWPWILEVKYEDGYKVKVSGDSEEDCINRAEKFTNLHGEIDYYGGYNDGKDYFDGEYIPDEDLPESIDSATDVEDEIQEIGQEFTSENTSINSGKLPAIFRLVNFEPGTTNLDYGGGRFDNVAEYLEPLKVVNLVYDPYNRSESHNKEVIKILRDQGGADTATCSNVLNVIKEPWVRENVLRNIKKLVKPGGKVYITVYEGTGKGNEGPTKAGYQLNKKTADYLEEIQNVFPDASRKGKLIVATN